MVRKSYSQEELKFLQEGFKKWRVPELTEKFNEKFTQSRTLSAIRSTLKREGFKCGRKPGFRKGERLLAFTQEQLEFVKAGYRDMPLKELTEAFNAQFGTEKTVSQIRGLTRNQRIRSGRTGRFEKGNVPWCNGLAGKGVCKPNKGCFTPGSVPVNTRALGDERVAVDGFVWVKVDEPNPYVPGQQTSWMQKHICVWEKEYGPLPEGMVVRFKDGDRQNCDPDNLMLVSKSESMAMTRLGYHRVDKDFKPTVALMAKVEARAGELKREYEND